MIGALAARNNLRVKNAREPSTNNNKTSTSSHRLTAMRNFQTRIAEHCDPSYNSEPARHLKNYPSQTFSWKVLFPAPGYIKRKIIEGLFIKQKTPLNKQVNCFIAQLFPTGIT